MLTYYLLLLLIERFVHKVSIVHARKGGWQNQFPLKHIDKKKPPDIGSGKKSGGIRDTRFTFV